MEENEMEALADASMASWYLTWNIDGDIFAPSHVKDTAWEQLTLAEARRRQLTLVKR